MKNIIEYLHASADLHGDKICFGDRYGSITFSELENAAMNLANKIVDVLDNRTNKPIPVYLDKSISSIISFIAIIYSGNYYVPIDTKSPTERVKKILSVIDPEIVLSSHEGKDSFALNGVNLSVLTVDDISQDRETERSTFRTHLSKKIKIIY